MFIFRKLCPELLLQKILIGTGFLGICPCITLFSLKFILNYKWREPTNSVHYSIMIHKISKKKINFELFTYVYICLLLICFIPNPLHLLSLLVWQDALVWHTPIFWSNTTVTAYSEVEIYIFGWNILSVSVFLITFLPSSENSHAVTLCWEGLKLENEIMAKQFLGLTSLILSSLCTRSFQCRLHDIKPTFVTNFD